MAIIVTRETGATAKNAPLTNQEVDTNFININNELVENTNNIELVRSEVQDSALIMAIALG